MGVENQSAEMNELTAALVHSSVDAIVGLTLDGRVETWNAGATRLFGYAGDESIGQPFTRLVAPEGEQEHADLLRRAASGVSVAHHETVRVAKGGRQVSVSISLSPLRRGDRIVGAVEIARDMTGQKRGEKTLLEETRILETLNQVGQTVAAELDLERLVQVVTDAATTLAGAEFGAFFYNVENEAGESYMLYTLSGVPREAFAAFPMPRNTEIFGPTFRGAVMRSDDITKDARFGKNAPYSGMPPGHLPVRSYLAVPVTSRSGEVLGGLFFGHSTVGVFTPGAERLVVSIASQAAIGIDNARLYQSAQTEIAQRQRAEQARQRSERVYRAIGESIDYGTWVCDASGRNTYASDSFLELVGLSQAQCSEFGWGDVLHPEDRQQTIEEWKECVRTGKDWDREHRFLGKDGRYHTLLARGVPIRDEQGNIVAWAGINLDMSRLKQAQDELREADRRKDEFLATLAHELRNPLAPIRYALAVNKEPGRTAAQQREAEAIVDRQVEHMSRLLEDLLDVSRITHGALELRKVPIELSSAVNAAVEAARPILDTKGHTLSVNLPSEPIQLEVDPVRMVQIFTNLLINAAKYTPDGGRVELRAWREQGDLVLAVKDNGIGISPEMKPRLFKAFSQVQPALERSEGGLGIGLALVHGLVTLHGGSIEAHSEGRLKGSEFIVHLPLTAGDVNVLSGAAARVAPAPALVVLVADDNVDNAEVSATLLDLWGHEVVVAHAGYAALELAERARPQVLLLDIGMPDLNGYEVAAAVRAAPWGRDMTLVAVTGWGRDEDRRRALSAGFNHHLTKPVDPVKLKSLLDGLDMRR
jgi:PAS domain S-box-containing protein